MTIWLAGAKVETFSDETSAVSTGKHAMMNNVQQAIAYRVFGLRWRPLIVAKRSFKDMLEGLTGYVDWVIMLLFKLPVILLWLATIGGILYALFKLVRRFYYKLFKRQE